MKQAWGMDQGSNAAGEAMARPPSGMDRIASLLRPLLVVFAAVAAMFYVVVTIHWAMAADSVIMHYVNFLMQHGLRPYIDISDNNMPGAYYTEGLAMRVFGTGDLAWRVYDFFLLAIIVASLIVIAKPYDWVAGVFAGGLFLLIHAAEGPSCSVERDQMLTVMLMIGYAAMFTAVKRNKPWLLFVVGLVYGMAASIKPTFLPLALGLLALLGVVLRRNKMRVLPFLLWALLGLVVIFGVDLGYLLYHGSLRAFLFSLQIVSKAYVAVGRKTPREMISAVFPRNLRILPLLVGAAAIALRKRRIAWTWEHWALSVGVVFGLVSFFVQGKGYLYHRYTYLVPVLLLMSFVMTEALRQRGAARIFVLAGFALIVLYALPWDVRAALDNHPTQNPIQADLQRLGGSSALDDKVQCFDLVYGCFSALYHLRIVENTGFTGDLLFFGRVDGAAARYFKQMYWRAADRDPATVLVISNEWYGEENSFNKLSYWPEFQSYVQQNYTLVAERRVAPDATEDTPEKFRLYVRKGTPLLAKSQAMAAAGQL